MYVWAMIEINDGNVATRANRGKTCTCNVNVNDPCYGILYVCMIGMNGQCD
jgi:hypothetical protein